MEKLIVQIGANSDHFEGFAENCNGVYGSGNTVEACKKNVLENLRLYILNTVDTELPEILKGEFEIEFNYEV